MKRHLYEKLLNWKKTPDSKPLIIKGARQVGKTYLMLDFAKNEYPAYVYINFEKEESIKKIFEGDINPKDIIEKIEIVKGKKINKDTLIIFDEVQEVKRALTSLKYFYEEAKEYKILCSGSNMGIALHEGTSFPVGKVEIINMYPMTFEEFLGGLNKTKLLEVMNGKDKTLLEIYENDFIQYLRLYYYIGGMPEAVCDYINNKDLQRVREIQQQIVKLYKEDFSKHLSNEVPTKINMVYDSIPSQLAKENKKFLYGLLKTGGRAKEYEFALNYLKDIGLIHFVNRTSKPSYPLELYNDIAAFKVYLSDVGLLSCMCKVEKEIAVFKNDIFVEYKGAITEQYVLQQLITKCDYRGFYYSNETSTGEIDFLYQKDGKIIPVEVKAEVNLQAKSLKNYVIKYKPLISIKTSMKPYKREQNVVNIPLYDIGNIDMYV